MTRLQKILKLANAIKAFRGKYLQNSKGEIEKWIEPPNPSKAINIKLWADRLGLDPYVTFKKVTEFKTFQDYNDFMKNIPATNNKILNNLTVE